MRRSVGSHPPSPTPRANRARSTAPSCSPSATADHQARPTAAHQSAKPPPRESDEVGRSGNTVSQGPPRRNAVIGFKDPEGPSTRDATRATGGADRSADYLVLIKTQGVGRIR